LWHKAFLEGNIARDLCESGNFGRTSEDDTMRWLFALIVLGLRCPIAEGAGPVALAHATVIDVTGRPPQVNMTLIVRDGRIVTLGKADEVDVPSDAQVVNATGKFLIPGLWDVHVHTVSPSYFPLYLANGVTGVRDMHSFLPDTPVQWREDIAAGKTLGPRMVVAGALIDGANPFWPGSFVATDEKSSRAAVTTLKAKRVDFIKVYSRLSRDAFLAIADEAKTQGLTFAGHVPESVTAAEASDAGQKSMEHLEGILIACSTREEELHKELEEALSQPDNTVLRAAMRRVQAKAVDSYSEDKAQALFARFVKNGTWQVPTLTVLHALSSLEDPQFTNDPRTAYMPLYVLPAWKLKPPPADVLADMKKAYSEKVKLVRAMHRAGVRLLAGTDVTNPFCFPGFSLHDELALLVEAGLTPLEALQSATRGPAEFLGKDKDLGTVEVGKWADLVLLDADPLQDITNTRKIAGVMTAGRFLAKNELEAMLAKAKR
jgi:imidazolonepropionase-like amidohydrolase